MRKPQKASQTTLKIPKSFRNWRHQTPLKGKAGDEVMTKSVLRAISSQDLAQQLCHQVTILPPPQKKSGGLFCYKTSITLGSFIIMTTVVILLLIKKIPISSYHLLSCLQGVRKHRKCFKCYMDCVI